MYEIVHYEVVNMYYDRPYRLTTHMPLLKAEPQGTKPHKPILADSKVMME